MKAIGEMKGGASRCLHALVIHEEYEEEVHRKIWKGNWVGWMDRWMEGGEQ